MKDPKVFLKGIGMQFDVKPSQIDKRFEKSLSPEAQENLGEIWEMISMGMDASAELYCLPTSLKQATLLFSHDASRYRSSLAWIRDVALKTSAKRIFEVGCGAGITSAFLQSEIIGSEVCGIDTEANLVAIASELTGAEFVTADYLTVAGNNGYDLVVCNFGFDNSNFRPSQKPHGAAKAGQFKYCPGCFEDLMPQFIPYFGSWKNWMHPAGKLAVVGRFSDVGKVFAAGKAAEICGLKLVDDFSTTLKVVSNAGKEVFPAMVFEISENAIFREDDAARIYSR